MKTIHDTDDDIDTLRQLLGFAITRTEIVFDAAFDEVCLHKMRKSLIRLRMKAFEFLNETDYNQVHVDAILKKIHKETP